VSIELAEKIKSEALRLGFTLAGITTPETPPHISTYQNWLDAGRHASMAYLENERTRSHRNDPRLILPECQSILLLAAPYPDSKTASAKPKKGTGKIASYAWNDDYHLLLPEKMNAIVAFIENDVGHSVPNRWYTDTGPILERDLAQRAGLGWIGKNTCLISPQHGSYFFLAEILLGIELPSDEAITSDHCGTCTRCIEACPTQAILPNRTLDANRCISFLTIENKGDISEELRPKLGEWVFGCDICQIVCPWNRFASPITKAKINPRPNLISELNIKPQEFNKKFKNNPVKRAKRRGYLRNVAVALGNAGDPASIPALEKALNDIEPLVRDHAQWALDRIKSERE
jgi:epoxyqueuosine reductase